MDIEKAKLRVDLDALAQVVAGLVNRLEVVELKLVPPPLVAPKVVTKKPWYKKK